MGRRRLYVSKQNSFRLVAVTCKYLELLSNSILVWVLTSSRAGIVGCVSSAPLAPISFSDTSIYPYDGQQICATKDGALYCSKPGCRTCSDIPLATGCVDLFTSISSTYSEVGYYYTYSTYTWTYMNKYNYTYSTSLSTWTVNGSTSVRPETYIYTESVSEELTSDMTSMLSWYVLPWMMVTYYLVLLTFSQLH